MKLAGVLAVAGLAVYVGYLAALALSSPPPVSCEVLNGERVLVERKEGILSCTPLSDHDVIVSGPRFHHPLRKDKR